MRPVKNMEFFAKYGRPTRPLQVNRYRLPHARSMDDSEGGGVDMFATRPHSSNATVITTAIDGIPTITINSPTATLFGSEQCLRYPTPRCLPNEYVDDRLVITTAHQCQSSPSSSSHWTGASRFDAPPPYSSPNTSGGGHPLERVIEITSSHCHDAWQPAVSGCIHSNDSTAFASSTLKSNGSITSTSSFSKGQSVGPKKSVRWHAVSPPSYPRESGRFNNAKRSVKAARRRRRRRLALLQLVTAVMFALILTACVYIIVDLYFNVADKITSNLP